ncbi:GGDEF domain-containing protein [Nisaea sp.]|uniref:GGDEF domain-containing protein n=1 Tax=Nisaea sp. TaxID=2024842 RepID=UPI0032EDB3DE
MNKSAKTDDQEGTIYSGEYFAYVRGLFAAASVLGVAELCLNFDWFLGVPLWLKVVRVSLTVIAIGYWLGAPRYDPVLRHAFKVGLLFLFLRILTLSHAAEPMNVAFYFPVALIALMTIATTRREVWAALAICVVSFLIARAGDLPVRAYLGLSLVSGFAGYFGLSFLRFRARLFELLALLKDQTRTDQLTGLKNRRALQDDIESGFRLLESDGTGFSLLLIDVDHFKKVNDRYGHGAGDAILKLLASEIRHDVRAMDPVYAGAGTVYRFGGEEFAVILPNTDLEGASVAAERLRRRIHAKQFQADPLESPIPGGGVTISIGVAGAEPGSGWSEVYSAADQALYRAKDLGRNRVERADQQPRNGDGSNLAIAG